MHKFEITDKQLAVLRNALLIAFKSRLDLAEQLAKSPGLEHIAGTIRDKANEFDDLRYSLPKLEVTI